MNAPVGEDTKALAVILFVEKKIEIIVIVCENIVTIVELIDRLIDNMTVLREMTRISLSVIRIGSWHY